MTLEVGASPLSVSGGRRLLPLIGIRVSAAAAAAGVVVYQLQLLFANRCLGTTNLLSHALLISSLGRNYNEVVAEISIIKPQGAIPEPNKMT